VLFHWCVQGAEKAGQIASQLVAMEVSVGLLELTVLGSSSAVNATIAMTRH
jgi:hypothetical protein